MREVAPDTGGDPRPRTRDFQTMCTFILFFLKVFVKRWLSECVFTMATITNLLPFFPTVNDKLDPLLAFITYFVYMEPRRAAGNCNYSQIK